MTAVSDLFRVEYGHSLSLNALRQVRPGEGAAYVSRTARNNGVAAYISPPAGLTPFDAGLLTVALRSRNYTLATFVQPQPFFTGYHIHVLHPLAPMTVQEKVWWAQCITANRYRYNFGRQANRTLASLQLPDVVPPWVATTPLETYAAPATATVGPLSAENWGRFRLEALFGMTRGRNVLKRDMRPGPTRYVSASATDNGVSGMVDLVADWPGGQITVASNGSVGEAFYQPAPFIASGDVTVLDPKESLTPAAALFVCSVIRGEKYRWNYGRKWVTSRMRESEIRLPTTDAGAPDWEFMTSYIGALPLAKAVGIS